MSEEIDLDRFERALVRAGSSAACAYCQRETCEGCRPKRVRNAEAVMVQAPPREIVESLVAPGRITLLAGASGAAKTFIAIDLAAAIGDGRSWHGRETTLGSTVYVSFEGGLKLRLLAARDGGGYSLENFFVREDLGALSPHMDYHGNESPSVGAATLAAELEQLDRWLAYEHRPPLRAVIVDTVRQSLVGSEDSSADTSRYLRGVRQMTAGLKDAGAVLVHHAGWQDNAETRRKRERGSSAWRADVDYAVYAEAEDFDHATGEASLTITWTKCRDGEMPRPLRLLRRRVEVLATDKHGQPLTSCVIADDPRTDEELAAERQRQEQAREREREARQEARHDARNEARATKERERGEKRVADLQRAVIEAIRAHTITSQIELRAFTSGRQQEVGQALARAIAAGLVARKDHRGEPYRLTEAGSAFLKANISQFPGNVSQFPT